jgi:tetratricopeptide (TPR) repeat protein
MKYILSALLGFLAAVILLWQYIAPTPQSPLPAAQNVPAQCCLVAPPDQPGLKEAEDIAAKSFLAEPQPIASSGTTDDKGPTAPDGGAGSNLARDDPKRDEPPALQPSVPGTLDNHGVAKEAYERALKLIASGSVSEPMPYLDRVIQLDPEFADAYSERGALLGRQNNSEAALQDFGRAISLHSKLARTYSNRGNCYWNLKKIDLAIQDYNAAISIDNTVAEVFATRGMAYSRTNNFAVAEADLRQAIRLGSQNPSAYHNLGYVMYMQQRYVEAIQYFDQAIGLKPDVALSFRLRGLAKQAIGNITEASADLEHARALGDRY